MAVAACAPRAALEEFDTNEIEVGQARLTVAVADTREERHQGLRGVEELPEGIEGMLFDFGDPTTTSFGMRDTLIPLDIWWFDGEGRLLGSTRMEPCASEPCPTYGSPGEIAWALETPAGEVDLSPGDSLSAIGS